MTEKLKQITQEEVSKLAPETQDAINSVDWAKITENIGRDSFLWDNDINNLQVETLLVLIGIEDINDYPENIENEIGTSKKEAEKIAGEVLQKIFTPINNILIEKIKASGKSRNTTPEQNLDFILSGGDYSVFMDIPPRSDASQSTPQEGNNEPEETVLPVFSIK
ncbi:hypothetical protein A3A03_01240 [Candidatus Nomurabacteria bacterium RIFCSPLOWO2_01_FULL_40_18]|uniref:Uncharacterized protein n=1 Tax=Candidatus Nomurabacteria bacterium RIFCSPLOWO2_01_FULL_40_18 TaxID=1801773 RepID=A0A1F6XKG4_9BACT|nr:MAG: hypothetical protein A3A03_01240 [Candidatus Nomurabacteria bacterium RIFCSPLOWO2_01_FULL_40_18]